MEFKKINVDYITEKEAIAIANNELKQAIFKEGKKQKRYYGLLLFEEFAIKLIKDGDEYAWLIKLTKGEWGATEYKGFFVKNEIMSDGEFDEESNIRCLVYVDTGEFIYLAEDDKVDFQEVNEKEYEEYKQHIKYNSFFIRTKEERKYPLQEKSKRISWENFERNIE